MHQGGGLQSLARRFLSHLLGSQLAQLVVDQRQKLVSDLGVALADGIQDLGYFTHESEINRAHARGQALKVRTIDAVLA